MSWDLARQQCAAARATVFGKSEPGVYTPPGGGAGVSVTARLRLDATPQATRLRGGLAAFNEFSEIVEPHDEIKLLASEVNARRDGTVSIDDVEYRLVALIEDTGIETRWEVKR